MAKIDQIEIRVEEERMCGFRKAGGYYLVSGGEFRACGKLPKVLDVCPTCSAGIKYSRGWTWVDAVALFKDDKCKMMHSDSVEHCSKCVLNNDAMKMNEELKRAGLLWIGKQFYKSSGQWMEEAVRLGVSRRIKAVPNGFKIGETWVLLAHLEGAEQKEWSEELEKYTMKKVPAIFQVFKPTAVEYVCKGNETDEEIDRLEERGITPVRVKQAELVGS